MSHERARQLLRAARAINRERSRMEQAMGYTAPEDGPADVLLRTVMVAFWVALVEEDWEMVSEGYLSLAGVLSIHSRPPRRCGHANQIFTGDPRPLADAPFAVMGGARPARPAAGDSDAGDAPAAWLAEPAR